MTCTTSAVPRCWALGARTLHWDRAAFFFLSTGRGYAPCIYMTYTTSAVPQRWALGALKLHWDRAAFFFLSCSHILRRQSSATRKQERRRFVLPPRFHLTTWWICVCVTRFLFLGCIRSCWLQTPARCCAQLTIAVPLPFSGLRVRGFSPCRAPRTLAVHREDEKTDFQQTPLSHPFSAQRPVARDAHCRHLPSASCHRLPSYPSGRVSATGSLCAGFGRCLLHPRRVRRLTYYGFDSDAIWAERCGHCYLTVQFLRTWFSRMRITNNDTLLPRLLQLLQT